MELAAIMKIIAAAAQLAEVAAPHIKAAIATASESDVEVLKADLAKLAAANDAAFDRVQGELRG